MTGKWVSTQNVAETFVNRAVPEHAAELILLPDPLTELGTASVVFVNENGEKRENNEFVNEN